MSETIAVLEITPADFAEGIKPLRKTRVFRTEEEVRLNFDGNRLMIEGGTNGIEVQARGTWPGQARVSAAFINTLVKVPPAGNPIVFKVIGGRIHAGTISLACSWQPTTASQIALPPNATMMDYLHIAERYNDREIETAGLLKIVQLVRIRRDEKIDRAARHLQILGVTAAELRAWISRRVLGDKR